MSTSFPPSPPSATRDEYLAHLEARLARIETHLGLESAPGIAPIIPAAAANAPADDGPATRGNETNFERHGFAIAGITALAAGVAYMLSLPYPGLPVAAPGALGIALAGGLLLAARFGRRTLGSLAIQVGAAGMLLLFLATLRLPFIGREPALDLDSLAGRALLVLTLAINAAFAWQERSPWLALLVVVTGCLNAIAVGTGGFLLALLSLLAAGVVVADRRRDWPLLRLAGIVAIYATYFTWAIGNPLRGGGFHFVAGPAIAPWALLVLAAIFAAGHLARAHREEESDSANLGAALNCAVGYGCFLVHTAAAFPRNFVALHGAAFALFLGVALLFWVRERSRVATFIYALTGYGALSMAIIKAAPSPAVFVWLSAQSIVVVTTAIWFRSRLIVVANFLIFTGIVTAYLVLAERETGISLGFGLVALVSARILHWQQDRLELRTGLMRNAYLASAFVVFPYALHHLMPVRLVALAWVGLAVLYYALNLVIQNQKYRWMGHGTLGLAGIFLVFARSGELEPAYRIASFLALGIVLLIVSLSVGRVRGRARVEG